MIPKKEISKTPSPSKKPITIPKKFSYKFRDYHPNPLMTAVLQRKKMNPNWQFKNSSTAQESLYLKNYQLNCSDKNICFLCETEGIKYKNQDCGCELWCEDCASWVREVQVPPHVCIICGDKVTGWKVTERYVDQTVGFAKSLQEQRHHFEAKLIAAKLKKASAVEEAVDLKMKDMECKLEQAEKEKQEAEEKYKNNMKKQDILRNLVKSLEERENAKDQKILDLEEQITDIKANLEGRRQVTAMGIQGSAYVAPRGNATRKTRRRR